MAEDVKIIEGVAIIADADKPSASNVFLNKEALKDSGTTRSQTQDNLSNSSIKYFASTLESTLKDSFKSLTDNQKIFLTDILSNTSGISEFLAQNNSRQEGLDSLSSSIVSSNVELINISNNISGKLSDISNNIKNYLDTAANAAAASFKNQANISTPTPVELLDSINISDSDAVTEMVDADQSEQTTVLLDSSQFQDTLNSNINTVNTNLSHITNSLDHVDSLLQGSLGYSEEFSKIDTIYQPNPSALPEENLLDNNLPPVDRNLLTVDNNTLLSEEDLTQSIEKSFLNFLENSLFDTAVSQDLTNTYLDSKLQNNVSAIDGDTLPVFEEKNSYENIQLLHEDFLYTQDILEDNLLKIGELLLSIRNEDNSSKTPHRASEDIFPGGFNSSLSLDNSSSTNITPDRNTLENERRLNPVDNTSLNNTSYVNDDLTSLLYTFLGDYNQVLSSQPTITTDDLLNSILDNSTRLESSSTDSNFVTDTNIQTSAPAETASLNRESYEQVPVSTEPPSLKKEIYFAEENSSSISQDLSQDIFFDFLKDLKDTVNLNNYQFQQGVNENHEFFSNILEPLYQSVLNIDSYSSTEEIILKNLQDNIELIASKYSTLEPDYSNTAEMLVTAGDGDNNLQYLNYPTSSADQPIGDLTSGYQINRDEAPTSDTFNTAPADVVNDIPDSSLTMSSSDLLSYSPISQEESLRSTLTTESSQSTVASSSSNNTIINSVIESSMSSLEKSIKDAVRSITYSQERSLTGGGDTVSKLEANTDKILETLTEISSTLTQFFTGNNTNPDTPNFKNLFAKTVNKDTSSSYEGISKAVTKLIGTIF